jgi:hypothetical protein
LEEKRRMTDAPAQRRVYAAIRDPKPEAVVVYCSDPRFQPACEQFIALDLGLAKGQYVPLVVGGGIGPFSHPEQLPKEFKFMKERFEFYRDHFPSIRRVVLINHEDCKYYDSIKGKLLDWMGGRFHGAARQIREDLPLALSIFDRCLSHLAVQVDLYYARFADAERTTVAFDKLEK